MKFRNDSSDRRFLVPDITGFRKPVFNKNSNGYEVSNEDKGTLISLNIREIKQVG